MLSLHRPAPSVECHSSRDCPRDLQLAATSACPAQGWQRWPHAGGWQRNLEPLCEGLSGSTPCACVEGQGDARMSRAALGGVRALGGTHGSWLGVGPQLESSWVTVTVIVTGAAGPVGGEGRDRHDCIFRKALSLGYYCPGGRGRAWSQGGGRLGSGSVGGQALTLMSSSFIGTQPSAHSVLPTNRGAGQGIPRSPLRE